VEEGGKSNFRFAEETKSTTKLHMPSQAQSIGYAIIRGELTHKQVQMLRAQHARSI
jgi:hypothetical protein